MALMRSSAEGKLIVKHTFLEFVEMPIGQRKRSFTEGAIGDSRLADMHNCSLHCDSLEADDVHLVHPVEQDRMQSVRKNAELHVLEESASAEHLLAKESMDSPYALMLLGLDQHRRVANNVISHAFVQSPSTYLPTNFVQDGYVDRESHGPHQTCDRSAATLNIKMPTYSRVPNTCQAPTISLANCVAINENPVEQFTLTEDSDVSNDSYTTVMLRNLPNMYTREMFIHMLNSEGFAGKYTFAYLPIDFKSHAGLGYAFVDMVCPADAVKLREHFEGFSRWVLASEKRCTVSWSHPDQQGYLAHVERYRNSPVMHKSVPDEWKPVLFSVGERVSFPRPTRKIRAPRIRPCQ